MRGWSHRGDDATGEAGKTGPIDHDPGQSRSFQPHSATAAAGLFETPRSGSEPQQLVGYRVIRMLGRGSRATVYLGHRPAESSVQEGFSGDPGDDPGGERQRPVSAAADVDELVALKVFHPGTAQSSIDLEVRALTASFGQHVLSLTDVATTPGGGVVLVLPYLAGGTLAQLLERRSRLRPGEAVNIVAPLVTAVLQLYSSGFRHVSLSSTRVLFSARGTPVLAGIGRARAIHVAAEANGSPAELGQEPEIWQSLVVLADEVLAHVRPDDSDGSRPSPRAGLARPDPETTLEKAAEQFMTELFEWAEPEAVARDDPAIQPTAPSQAHAQVPGRTHRGKAFRPGGADRAGAPGRVCVGEAIDTGLVERSWLGVFHLPAQLRDGVERALDLNPVHVLKDTWAAASARTRRMLVAGGVVFAVASAAVLLAIPSDSQATGPIQEAGGRAGAPAAASAVDSRPLSMSVDSADSDPMISAAERSTILSADPLVAVEVLLAVRQRCLRERSLVCLLDVVQENTALMDADRTGLRDRPGWIGGPDEPPVPVEPRVGPQTHIATLVERSGDAALILWEPRVAHENQPISVLMMRAETGWRLREIFD